MFLKAFMDNNDEPISKLLSVYNYQIEYGLRLQSSFWYQSLPASLEAD